MTQQQWIMVLIALIGMISTLGVNLFIMGRFTGKVQENIASLTQSVERVDRRIDDVDNNADKAKVRADEAHARQDLTNMDLVQVKAALEKFWELRDRFTSMETSSKIHAEQQRESTESIKRTLSGIERQFANLMTTRVDSGLTLSSREDIQR